jgi:hypothetical protein
VLDEVMGCEAAAGSSIADDPSAGGRMTDYDEGTAEADPRTSLIGRASTRPVLYPAGMLIAIVLAYLVQSGVSPYAAMRPLLTAITLGLVAPWLLGLVTGDRHRSGVLALVLIVILVVGQSLLAVGLWGGLVVLTIVGGPARGTRPTRIRWPVITRALTAFTVILLVAIGIAAVQNGRIGQIANDLVSDGPFPRARSASAAAAPMPSVYLLLLDGYPRADKLTEEFAIDNAPFVDALRARSFIVADHSRSNQVLTDATLASIFNGDVPENLDPSTAGYRELINHGRILQQFRDLGFEVVSFSPGAEGVALRAADQYVDSGQLNEFEWKVLRLMGMAPLVDAVWPTLLADNLRGRVMATLDAIPVLARDAGTGPRLVFAHILSPHAPLILGTGGDQDRATGLWVDFTDWGEYQRFGRAEYSRRLAEQISYLNRRVLQAVEAIVVADPEAVIVIFSDHGSGIRVDVGYGGPTDVDLRTANLLAVLSPGHPDLIDDRSTLVNVLPRILRAYGGTGPSDVPETIFGRNDKGKSIPFDRPD